MEASRRTADLKCGEGRSSQDGSLSGVGGGREKIAEKEAHGAYERVFKVTNGVDLDVDGGGLTSEEIGSDTEEEPVVPGRVFPANFVKLSS